MDTTLGSCKDIRLRGSRVSIPLISLGTNSGFLSHSQRTEAVSWLGRRPLPCGNTGRADRIGTCGLFVPNGRRSLPCC